jgi:hypothetical protein
MAEKPRGRGRGRGARRAADADATIGGGLLFKLSTDNHFVFNTI